MATQDLRQNSTYTSEPSWNGRMKQFELRQEVDFSDDNVSSADVVQVLNLKADTLVKVYLRVTTAEGATATADVKTDETTPQTFMEEVDLNAAGLKYGDGADGDAACLEKYIAEDCVLGIVPDHDLDTAVVEVIVVGYDFRDTP